MQDAAESKRVEIFTFVKNIDKKNQSIYKLTSILIRSRGSMFGIGVQELIIIAIIALLIVGPKKLPDLAKTLGKGFRDFKNATEGVTEDLKDALKEDETPKPDDGLKDSLLSKKPGAEEGKKEASGNET